MLVGRGPCQLQPVRVRAGTRTRSAANDGRGLRAGATAHARWRRLGATPTLLGREALNNGGGQGGERSARPADRLPITLARQGARYEGAVT